MNRTAVLIASISAFTGISGVHLAEQTPETVIELRSTARLPDGDGVVKVHQHGATTTLSVALDDLKPATLFGGDYSTYILWAISQDGETANLGELILNGDRSEKNISTRCGVAQLIVTAEPHFLVERPSRFVVLESVSRAGDQRVRYRSFEGSYNYERDSLEDALEARGEVRSDLKQALTAFRLAQRAGASTYATEELLQAERALDAAIAFSRDQAELRIIESHARQAVRLAVVAQNAAMERRTTAILAFPD